MISQLLTKDLSALVVFQRRLNDSLDIGCKDGFRGQALLLLEQLFRGQAGNFYLTKTGSPSWDISDFVTRGLTENMHKSFQEYYYQFDPILQHNLHYKPSPIEVTSLSDLVPSGRLDDTEYGFDFFKPQNIHHQVNGNFWVSEHLLATVSLFRSSSEPEFDSRDRLMMELTVGLLRGALQSLFHRDQSLKIWAVAESLASQFRGRGVLVLDQQLELVFADKNALRILGGGQPCFPSCGKLELGMDILSQIRSEAALTDLETVHAKKLALTASCSSKPLWARLHVARTEIGLPFLVVTFDRGEPVQSWLGQVRACGVSRRETEVIAAVLQGLTNQEVARSLFISEHTVENHLKSIYRKLGVKNRTRLMRALTQ